MIEIKVSGFKDQTREFEQPNQALCYLTELKDEHNVFLSNLISHIPKPELFWSNPKARSESSDKYVTALREISRQHPLKVEIVDIYSLMGDLI